MPYRNNKNYPLQLRFKLRIAYLELRAQKTLQGHLPEHICKDLFYKGIFQIEVLSIK